ncbi:MAG: ATP-binding cassette domain-containing protein [Gammaproteobacteria bacterium]|jgi:putative ABC transport system ATP-binding protein|nr:ATP-binding cassette domain-containing protein [Gammaproteobacteria bacterium]
MPADQLLELRDLRFAWRRDHADVIALDAFSLKAGERVFLYGPSGSGKSTLLALIAGLARPDRGGIRFAGTQLEALRGPARDRFRADHVGVIFQQFNLLPWLDVLGNVILPCRFSRLRAERAGSVQQSARQLLAAMDLDQAMWSRKAGDLSVGQQQRAAAARALIGAPELVLADEPTSALDSDRRDAFLGLLFEQVASAGATLLFVSHDTALADRFDRQVSLPEINLAGQAA